MESYTVHPVYLSPALPPPPFQLGATSGGGCIGNVALCWRRITFINLTLPARRAYTTLVPCTREGEPAWNLSRLRVAIARVVNDSFCVREQSGDLLREKPSSTFLMDAISRLTNLSNKFLQTLHPPSIHLPRFALPSSSIVRNLNIYTRYIYSDYYYYYYYTVPSLLPEPDTSEIRGNAQKEIRDVSFRLSIRPRFEHKGERDTPGNGGKIFKASGEGSFYRGGLLRASIPSTMIHAVPSRSRPIRRDSECD